MNCHQNTPYYMTNTILTHSIWDTDVSVLLYNCKQAGAKICAMIFAPVCLPPALYSFETFCQNQLFQVGADKFFNAGHFVSQHTMG